MGRLLCILMLAGTLGSFSLAQPEPAKIESPIACVIAIRNPVCTAGEDPNITVRLTNIGKKEIMLVRALDGSDYRWRYPLCYFIVIGPDGQPAGKLPPRCGNLDTLHEDAFSRVAAGESYDPYAPVKGYSGFPAQQLDGENFKQEGEYLIRFVYSTAQPKVRPWLGDHLESEAARFTKLLDQVPKTTVTSNEIRIRVVAKK